MCKIDGCDNKVYVKSRGLCRTHYLRWWKHGDPNICRTPKEYVATGSDSVNFKHGQWKHPLYKTWSNMMGRCYNENDQAYHHYGGRGIDVCVRWHNINNFIKDMGNRADGTSLERVDNEKGYSPENCIWATSTEQARNRRVVKLTFEKAEAIRALPRVGANGRGDGYTRAEIAELYGVSVATVKKVLSGAYWKEK